MQKGVDCTQVFTVTISYDIVYLSEVTVEAYGLWFPGAIVFLVPGEIKLLKFGTWKMCGWQNVLRSLRVTVMM